VALARQRRARRPFPWGRLIAPLLVSLASAQDPVRYEPDGLGRIWDSLDAGEPAVMLLCQVRQRPRVWTNGSHGALPISAATRVALGQDAAVMLLDAFAAIRAPGGEPVDERVDALLQRPDLLPPWVDWSGSGPVLSVGDLLACAGIAERVGSAFDEREAGAALAALSWWQLPRADEGVAVAVRAALGPAVSGIDPLDLAALPDRAFGSVWLGSDPPRDLRRARPAPLRLSLTVQAVAAWWQWRIEQGRAEAGLMAEPIPGYPGRFRCRGRARQLPGPWLCYYPDPGMACLVWAEAATQIRLVDAIEADLFGSLRMVRGIAAPSPLPQPPAWFAALAGSIWRAEAEAVGSLRMVIRDDGKATLEVDRRSFGLLLRQAGGQGGRFEVDDPTGTRRHELWLLSPATGESAVEALLVHRDAAGRVLPLRVTFHRADQGGDR
jgi:hypothetical protein